MNPDEPEADENTPEEEEWQLYATAGYAAAEDPWDDLVEIKSDEEKKRNGSMVMTSKPMDKLWIGIPPLVQLH